MLRLIPAPLHRAGYRLAHRLRLIWWRWRRPTIRGCRILALDADGRMLLVRHSYGSGNWMLPGGGLGRNEDAVAGACRELAEETGLTLTGAQLIDRLEEPLAGATNHVQLVAGRAAGQPRQDSREVIAAQFFAGGDWPSPLAETHRDNLDRWLRAAATALQE